MYDPASSSNVFVRDGGIFGDEIARRTTMRKILWIIMISAFPGLAWMTAQAAIPSYDSLYAFGDSYCDVGNLFTATGGAEPAAPYYNGRFSNGPLWLAMWPVSWVYR
jgi:hypothetical protein